MCCVTMEHRKFIALRWWSLTTQNVFTWTFFNAKTYLTFTDITCWVYIWYSILAPFEAIICLIGGGLLLMRSMRSVGIESKHCITLVLKSLNVSCSIWRQMASCSSIFLTTWKMFSIEFKHGLRGWIWWNSAWMSLTPILRSLKPEMDCCPLQKDDVSLYLPLQNT